MPGGVDKCANIVIQIIDEEVGGIEIYVFKKNRKCWVWYDMPPYHSECEIILCSENAVYRWNELRYDCTW